jgi:hypothetical protein
MSAAQEGHVPRVVVGVDGSACSLRAPLRAPRWAVQQARLGSVDAVLAWPAVVPRRLIASHVWEHEADAMGSNTIDVHLARLRSKVAGGTVRIESVRGLGYRIVTA